MIDQTKLTLSGWYSALYAIVNGRKTDVNRMPKSFRQEIVLRHNNYLDLICIMDTLTVCLEEPAKGTAEDRANAIARSRAKFRELGWTEAMLNELVRIQK